MDKEKILRDLDISIQDEVKDKQYVDRLGNKTDKVKYLRLVKHYTQEQTAEIANISIRQVQRLEKTIRE